MQRPQTISGLLLRLARLRPRAAACCGILALGALIATAIAVHVRGDEGAAVLPVVRHHDRSASVYGYAVAWNGNGYGLVHRVITEAYVGLVFQRLGTAGQRLGAPVQLGLDSTASPRLRWNGRVYGLVFEVSLRRRPPRSDIAFVRLAPDGRLVGSPVRLATGETAPNTGPRLAWTGREWGVAWHRLDGELSVHLARISDRGSIVGPDMAITAPCRGLTNPDLVADGRGYVLGHTCIDRDDRGVTVHVLRLDESGHVESSVDVPALRTTGWKLRLAVAGDSVGLLWEADEPARGVRGIVFARVRGSTVASPPRFVTDATRAAQGADVLATGDGFAALWADRRAARSGATFARFDPDGVPRDEARPVDTTDGEVSDLVLEPGDAGFGAFWLLGNETDMALHLARIGLDGRPVGDDVRVAP